MGSLTAWHIVTAIAIVLYLGVSLYIQIRKLVLSKPISSEDKLCIGGKTCITVGGRVLFTLPLNEAEELYELYGAISVVSHPDGYPTKMENCKRVYGFKRKMKSNILEWVDSRETAQYYLPLYEGSEYRGSLFLKRISEDSFEAMIYEQEYQTYLLALERIKKHCFENSIELLNYQIVLLEDAYIHIIIAETSAGIVGVLYYPIFQSYIIEKRSDLFGDYRSADSYYNEMVSSIMDEEQVRELLIEISKHSAIIEFFVNYF